MKTEDIDAAIDKLENNMAHTSMTLNEEKKIIAQISELRKSKAMVKELLESSGGKVDPAARETLEAQLKSVGAKITELKAQEQEQRKIMDEIKKTIHAREADLVLAVVRPHTVVAGQRTSHPLNS